MKRKKVRKIIKLNPQTDDNKPDDKKLENLLRELIEELSKTDDEQVKAEDEIDKKEKRVDSEKIVHLDKSRKNNENEE